MFLDASRIDICRVTQLFEHEGLPARHGGLTSRAAGGWTAPSELQENRTKSRCLRGNPAADTEQELGANVEHLQSASRGRVDPGISFQAHHQSRLVLCLIPKKWIDCRATVSFAS